MSVLTGQSANTKRLLDALGVPGNAISVQITIHPDEPVIVLCEYHPNENIFDDDGELETIIGQYMLSEVEDLDDGI